MTPDQVYALVSLARVADADADDALVAGEAGALVASRFVFVIGGGDDDDAAAAAADACTRSAFALGVSSRHCVPLGGTPCHGLSWRVIARVSPTGAACTPARGVRGGRQRLGVCGRATNTPSHAYSSGMMACRRISLIAPRPPSDATTTRRVARVTERRRRLSPPESTLISSESLSNLFRLSFDRERMMG